MCSVVPGLAVSSKCRPLAVVNIAGTKGLLELVFVTLLWCPSVTVASGEFVVQHHLGEAMVFQSGYVPCPA